MVLLPGDSGSRHSISWWGSLPPNAREKGLIWAFLGSTFASLAIKKHIHLPLPLEPFCQLPAATLKLTQSFWFNANGCNSKSYSNPSSNLTFLSDTYSHFFLRLKAKKWMKFWRILRMNVFPKIDAFHSMTLRFFHSIHDSLSPTVYFSFCLSLFSLSEPWF